MPMIYHTLEQQCSEMAEARVRSCVLKLEMIQNVGDCLPCSQNVIDRHALSFSFAISVLSLE